MKMSKFIKSTLILLVGGFLTKVLGMLIKIITTSTLSKKFLLEAIYFMKFNNQIDFSNNNHFQIHVFMKHFTI